MANTFTFTTSGAASIKAGLNVSSAAISGAILGKYSEQAEGQIVLKTRRDWHDGYPVLASGAKAMLDDTTSDLIAMRLIAYDMSGYTSRFEAQTMLDQLRDNANGNMKKLEDFKSDTIRKVS